jgi:SAM-dependent methyltransferase
VLGEALDYRVLRSLAHARLRATEAELDRLHAEQGRDPGAADAAAKLDKLLARFEGRFPLDPRLSYLDLGCGEGELALALARLGARRVTGVDFMPRAIEAARLNARRAAAGGAVRGEVSFLCADLHAWQPAARFDVLLSIDVFEHVRDPEGFLARMAGFLAPGGVAVMAFGPLFHSPFGDHMKAFFRVQLPWRGVLFNERALLRVRRECYRPTDPAERLQDIAGGLNRMRYGEFLRALERTGWRARFLRVNAGIPGPARAVSRLVTSLPWARDYFVHNVYAILER